ncbi:MAG: hypothetical protein KBT27_05775, partial [Prevotellaceae bacterium]|nr:hypothetical protein [Candidatus Faecinaster equi]
LNPHLHIRAFCSFSPMYMSKSLFKQVCNPFSQYIVQAIHDCHVMQMRNKQAASSSNKQLPIPNS